MRANCSDRASPRGRRPAASAPPRTRRHAWGGPALACRGFTLAELVLVLIIVGVMAVVALPRLQGTVGFDDEAWHQDVVSALRHGHHTAVAARRLVCATVASGSVTLSIAGSNPASSCSSNLPGYDGDPAFTHSSKAPATSSATMYFQPSGRVTSDGAGSTASDFTITISGQASVNVVGETGHVE